jgi:hypothetical protein
MPTEHLAVILLFSLLAHESGTYLITIFVVICCVTSEDESYKDALATSV